MIAETDLIRAGAALPGQPGHRARVLDPHPEDRLSFCAECCGRVDHRDLGAKSVARQWRPRPRRFSHQSERIRPDCRKNFASGTILLRADDKRAKRRSLVGRKLMKT